MTTVPNGVSTLAARYIRAELEREDAEKKEVDAESQLRSWAGGETPDQFPKKFLVKGRPPPSPFVVPR